MRLCVVLIVDFVYFSQDGHPKFPTDPQSLVRLLFFFLIRSLIHEANGSESRGKKLTEDFGSERDGFLVSRCIALPR